MISAGLRVAISGDGGVLQAGQRQRQGREAARRQRRGNRLAHGGVPGCNAGAIEQDRDERAIGGQGGERLAPGQGRAVSAER